MLLINKPSGITSHDVVDAVRRITGERRVGHAGTLDPFAEGLLIVLVGREETRRQSEFLKQPKTYEATFVFGAETTTDDRTGDIVNKTDPLAPLPREDLEKILPSFTGAIKQTPPAYSAIKLKGKKAYELARQGQTPALEPRTVTIHELEVLNFVWPEVTLRMHVSSGTYVRALARDMGRALGTGAYVSSLRRTSIGDFSLEDAQTLEQLRKT